MAVSKAAKMMAIGRPALSNFLNGKASLSQNMASRLERVFGADKEVLLSMQQDYDALLHMEKERKIAVKTYAPSFLEIRATNIEAWAEQLEARAELAALIRRLVNTTGLEIAHSNFPAYDLSQTPGWDGYVEAMNASPWVPHGISGWEFGCDKDPGQKANHDYAARMENVEESIRPKTTFVFVTPRIWKGKERWIAARRTEGEWKDVQAYDANDIEQWLETSVPAQIWLGGRLGIDLEGCQTLSDYWKFWSETAKPPICSKIFADAISAHEKRLKDWYLSESAEPIILAAASKEEALAFLACATNEIEELRPFHEQAVLVSNAQSVARLGNISARFIPVAYTASADQQLVKTFRGRRSITIVEKGMGAVDPDIYVDQPSHENFREALKEMGFNDGEIEIHTNRSGQSPTILRRQLATHPSLKRSAWAVSDERIRAMIPLVLAGAWKSDQDGDKEILRYLKDAEYGEIERDVAVLACLDDAPIWSEGKYRGVISILDCFHAISSRITKEDLDRFFFVAECVLGEDDPSLDLDKEKRWAANIYEKVRDHSGAIRKSICDGLTIMAVHGDALFGDRIGFPVEANVNLLIRRLLRGQTERVWQSQKNDLPKYAEAAPEEFLSIIEEELAKDSPAFASLFEPADSGMFGGCDRTGMLWALELLAWEPRRLSRVVSVLAKLCDFEPEDNWANKPLASLNDILLGWKPHTSAGIEERCNVVEFLSERFPEVAWKFFMQQLGPGPSFTSGTHRPSWRNDAAGAGQDVTYGDLHAVNRKCLDLALGRTNHTVETLEGLIDLLGSIPEEDQDKVVKHVRNWVKNHPPGEEVARLREHVRTRTLTQRARQARKKSKEGYANGRKIYEMLEPPDPILRHQWLFAKHWVEYSPEELEEEDLDHGAREEWLNQQRISALTEIWARFGNDGIYRLCFGSEAGSMIGWHLGKHVLNEAETEGFGKWCLEQKTNDDRWRIDSCVSGLILQYEPERQKHFIRSLIAQFPADAVGGAEMVLRLLLLAPFEAVTWEIVLEQRADLQERYWKMVEARWVRLPADDLNYCVDRLLEAGRPRAAFRTAEHDCEAIETKRLVKLLDQIATSTSEPSDHYQFASYAIERAFEVLRSRNDVEQSELARLEYPYARILTTAGKHGIPNLSRAISESPSLFMQLVALCFRRNDDGVDPPEWNFPSDPTVLKGMAENAYRVLECIDVIPGTDTDDVINSERLKEWICEVRRMSTEVSRPEVTDQKIGRLLSSCGTGQDGIWPCEEVRDVLEDIASEEIAIGTEIGLYNSRGAGFRPPDGAPERALSEKYRDFGRRVMNKTPFVGRMLFRIADSYERDAKWHDADHRVRRRLRGW
jgi:addiction module HigA family antidote